MTTTDSLHISPEVARGGAVLDFMTGLAKLQSIPAVYPGYIAVRIKKFLKRVDGEEIIADVGEVQTIGDCRHAIPFTDFNGTKYRIIVEVEGSIGSAIK